MIPGTARVRAARWWVVGLSAAYGAVALALALTVPSPQIRWVMTALVAAAVAAYTPLSRRINHHPVVVTVEDRRLDLGRFGAAPLDRPYPTGPWWDRTTGVNLGTVLHVLTDRGRVVRVGGWLASPGTDTARPARTVHITLSADCFAALLAALGLARPARPARVRVSLFARARRARACLPLLALYVAALGVSGASFALDRWGNPGPEGDLVAGYASVAIIVVALVSTIWITQRRRPVPALILDLDDTGCTLRDRRGRLVATGRPTWRKLRFQVRDQRGNLRNCPVLELVVATHQPLTLGLIDPEYAWRKKKVPETSMPRYLVGPPDWSALVDRIAF